MTQGCFGKNQYTLAVAKKQASWLRKKYHKVVTYYQCDACKKWHVGGKR